MQVFDFEQGTPEWFDARKGIVTASKAATLMAGGQGKTRLAYMYQLIGEIMTGEPISTFSGNAHTERGHEMEPVARDLYQKRVGIEVVQTGFIRNHDGIGGAGYSPDGLVGDYGLTEIKSRLPHIQAELLDTGKIPGDAAKQMQFGMWVSERQWCDYVSYWPGMPMFVQRVEVDKKQQDEMKLALIKFYAEMNQKLEKLASM
jgi:predicted phage-related endonuclease